MPVEIQVQGAEELAVIARHLKQTGNGELRKDLLRGLNQATKPLKADIKRSAQANLPRRGGLNARIAAAKLSTSNRMSGRNPGVRIAGKLAGHDLKSIDNGRLRHPVFGHRPWVLQDIAPGFFTKPVEDGAGKVRKELLDVLEDVARRCVSGG